MKVLEVKIQGELVKVSFDDGHQAVFEPYRHGFGYQVEDLRQFLLYQGERLVCRYNARLYRCGPQKDEHRIVTIVDGYTPQRVAEYWRAAKHHLNEECFEKPYREGRECPEESWYPWIVTREGWQDVERLEEGKTSLCG